MNNFYVYQLRVQGQKLPFYIGKGLGSRCYVHFNESLLRKPSHKNHTIRKALAEGLTVYVEVLGDGLSEEEAHRLEAAYIARYGRRDQGTGCLTNLTAGGEGQSGRIWGRESRIKISRATKQRMASPELRRHLSNLNRGKKLSSETKHKISRSVSVPEAQFISILKLHNPLFMLLEQNVRGSYSLFRCRHCGGEFECRGGQMREGRVPTNHYRCAVEAFRLDCGTRVYACRGGFGSPRLHVDSPVDQEFTFTLHPQGIVFYSRDGEELSRVRLPSDYMKARIDAERCLAYSMKDSNNLPTQTRI